LDAYFNFRGGFSFASRKHYVGLRFACTNWWRRPAEAGNPRANFNLLIEISPGTNALLF
jgi:hypothetical protein